MVAPALVPPTSVPVLERTSEGGAGEDEGDGKDEEKCVGEST